MIDYGLNSLALITDLIPAQMDSRISAYQDYIQIQTPTQPDYFWGNLLVFRRSPRVGDFDLWREAYRKAFDRENPTFFTFAWDECCVDQTAVQPFVNAGFELGIDITLVCSQPSLPPRFNEMVVVRPIVDEKDWAALPELHFNPNSPFPREAQIGFIEKRMESFRLLAEHGIGTRFGAFLDGKMVGELGVYHQDGLARFNEVVTHASHYRQGICQTLVYQASLHALKEFKARQLVIVADDGYHAIQAYKKVGFKELEKNYSLMWYDKKVYGP